MSGFLQFCDTYKDEQICIQALADMRWSNGFSCDRCKSSKSYHLEARPRIFECAFCGHQHSVTAGTVFHKTRTPLRKWFLAAYLMGQDKRGVSAMFLSRELDLRYETAWLLAHKLRHALTERQEFQLDQFVEADETFYGGRRSKGNRGRSKVAGKSLIVVAVEKIVARTGQGKGIAGQGFVAGNARIAVLPGATQQQLGGFLRTHVKPGTRLITDAFAGYAGLDEYRHTAIVQGAGENAEKNMPIIHILFSNMKAWLNGTHHGVSAKHLPRYLREWNYRFNRRGSRLELGNFLLRRATARGTITYAQLVGGMRPEGATA
jgi:transposase-like protein